MTEPEPTAPTGKLMWGQAGDYDAIDDRAVITALSGGRTGIVNAATFTAGSGLNVNIGPWVAVVDCADGTVGVAASTTQVALTPAAGPSSGSRTDVVWVDIDPVEATWTLGLYSEPDTVGRLGAELGRITAPAGANTASALTLTPADRSFSPGIVVLERKPNAAEPPSSYPEGVSLFAIAAEDNPLLGYPANFASVIRTTRVGNNVVQEQMRGTNATPQEYRRGGTGALWSAWVAVKLAAEAYGAGSIRVSNSVTATVAVTFPSGRFSAAPVGIATCGTTSFVISISGRSATSMTVGVRNTYGNASTATVPFTWYATTT